MVTTSQEARPSEDNAFDAVHTMAPTDDTRRLAEAYAGGTVYAVALDDHKVSSAEAVVHAGHKRRSAEDLSR